MGADAVLPGVLFLFGIGFLAANLKVTADLIRFFSRRSSAVLVWESPKPRYYGFALTLGAFLGLLLVLKMFVLGRTPGEVFGEAMMFLYFGYAIPLSTRIARGFYQDGVWADTGFMPWGQISAVSWREGETVTLVLVSQFRSIARRLQVPGHLYGQARRVLRDRVSSHDLHIGGAGLHLDSRDDRDAV